MVMRLLSSDNNVDVIGPEHELEIKMTTAPNGDLVLWINADGKCVCRVCQLPSAIVRFDVEESGFDAKRKKAKWAPSPGRRGFRP